ncbi:ferritin, liver middle subunit isoform X2 [Galendromus occidentalis]|uniref:Ferritin n=1 Tax=Galendromus occidentalis TaxID=34638 RepID=A0AAJ6VUU1_9ACAR|nr:ferritin, liver middle subunit isoform X2 [Galendromus occidentalis]
MNRLLYIVPLLFAVVSARLDNDVPSESSNKYHLHETCRVALQNQIDRELHASLVYQQMAAHFENNKVARKGFAKFFMDNSNEERDHAQKLISYINSRGGTIAAFRVSMPKDTTWASARAALESALELEIEVNNALHEVHGKAERDCTDPQLQDFLEANFLNEQVESIDNIHRLLATLNGMDQGLGEYLVNKDLQ